MYEWILKSDIYIYIYTYTHTHTGILFSHKKEGNLVNYDNMDGPCWYYAK